MRRPPAARRTGPTASPRRAAARRLRRDPVEAAPAPGQRQQQRHRRRHHQQRADHVEPVLARMIRHALEHVGGHAERGEAERQVDPEDQRPVEMLGEEAAEHRPADRGGGEHRADIALVAAALARRDDVGDDGLRQRHQPAAAQPLQRAPEHQRGHARRQRADQRAGDEHADGDQHHDAPAVDVGQLAVERRHRGGGEQIGGDHPGQVAEIGKVPADGRQRGGDDGLVERAEEHRQHDAEHDGARLPDG